MIVVAQENFEWCEGQYRTSCVSNKVNVVDRESCVKTNSSVRWLKFLRWQQIITQLILSSRTCQNSFLKNTRKKDCQLIRPKRHETSEHSTFYFLYDFYYATLI